MRRKPLLRRLAPWLVIAGLFIVWEGACRALKVPEFVLPVPSQIFGVLVSRWDALLPHATQTLLTTVAGFVGGVIVGTLIGIAIGSSRIVYEAMYPLLVGFYSIPKVAIVPILVIWFGSGTIPAVITSLVICIFPVTVNVATGLATTEPELEDVLRALGASKSDILWGVGIPRSMPYLFASLKIAVTVAFVGTVISETVAANRGIGNMMMIASSNIDVPLVFAGLFLLAFMGIALYASFAFLEHRMTGWAMRKNEFSV
ncbi:MAG TPA: ABC transporter permease [Burkholderiales bacterium]|nr:ABC transporter permease [Burkholderiales bacterium]